jgi:hypothetical protein
MPATLHLLKGAAPALALAAIAQQVAAGDHVEVALLHGAPAPPVPAGVATRRVPEECAYADLLEAIYAADQVIAW